MTAKIEALWRKSALFLAYLLAGVGILETDDMATSARFMAAACFWLLIVQRAERKARVEHE